MIITLDGPAGCGKSSVSRLLAEKLGFQFLDTGAMYRAVTDYLLENNISLSEIPEIKKALNEIEIRFENDTLFVNGQNRSNEIRRSIVDKNVSKVSSIGIVREKMVGLQRNTAKDGKYVVEGRDMGSVVFPDAEVKFYLTASVEERAQRRYKQIQEKGLIDESSSISLAEIKKDIERRDEEDQNREISPLKVPNGAIKIDTTGLSLDEVIHIICEYI